MRLQVVLYVAVLLCVLKLAAGACTNGVQLYNNGQCVCPSGFSSAACDQAATSACDASKTTAPPTQAERFPVLDLATATFTSNTLRISVLGPYVKDRQYTGIHFVNQSATTDGDKCALGSEGSYWTTSFADASACEDVFHVDLPWANHGDCGFKVFQHIEDSTNDLANENNQTAIAENHFVSYTAKFTLYYVDILGSIEGFALTRNTSVPYQIYVRFPTQLDVSLENVNVTSIVEMGIALTGDSYNPDNGLLTLEITIVNSWPNMLSPEVADWDIPNHPSQVSFSESDFLRIIDDPACTEDEGSICKQTYQFVFNTSSCTYDGTYNFTAPLYTCRGMEYQFCTFSSFALTFDLQTSSICSNITVEPPLQGRLVPFHSFDTDAFAAASVMPFTNPATDGFNIGQYGYFQIQLDNTQGNDVYLKIFEVSFQANGLSNKNYLVRNGVVMNDYANQPGNTDSADAFHYDEARFAFMDRAVNASADYTNLKAFSVYFSSVVFKVLPTSYTVYTFRVSAYATFLGNAGETDQGQKKRVVEYTFEASADQLSTYAKVGLKEAASDKVAVTPAEVANNNIGYIVGGGAAGLVAVAAAVFAVVRSKKNTYNTLETRA